MRETSEVAAARRIAADLGIALQAAPSMTALLPADRQRLIDDLATVQAALSTSSRVADPYAFALAGPMPGYRGGRRSGPVVEPIDSTSVVPAATEPKRLPATQTLAARAGALADEINFPAFVASLVHGTFDAVVDATIRQMEAYADLVSSVARNVEDFTNDNITPNQVRDHLVDRHAGDLWLDTSGGSPVVRVRVHQAAGEDIDDTGPRSPGWLADYNLAGQELTDEFVEQTLVPSARLSVGESRQQLLATMVLLGMSRINVRDGRISARVRFRAAATDKVDLDFATSQDPAGGAGGWGTRGSATFENATTMVSTVGVNAQSDTDLKVELFGQVELNFVSETLPLERFADTARMALLQRSARWQSIAGGAVPAASSPTVVTPPALVPTAPVNIAPIAPVVAAPTAPVNITPVAAVPGPAVPA